MIREASVLNLPTFPSEMVCHRMQEVLASGNPDIDNILNYLMANSGKMLRPRLVFLTASMGSYRPNTVIDVAVAVELIHMASLIHDDVIDQAATRRGQDSINQRWGNQASVLTGDYLFATAFNLINQHGMQSIMENITTTIRTMCAGEITQMSLKNDFDISVEQYLQKSHGKTACLFASSCKVGVLAAEIPEEVAYNLEQYGLCLGYAYQIIDDLLDFIGDSHTLGKPVGTDLLEGNITIPVIYALKSSDFGDQLRVILDRGFAPNEVSKVVQLLIASGAIEDSFKLSKQFIERGISYLSALPDNSTVRELESVASYLAETYYHTMDDYQAATNRAVQ